LTLRQAVGKSSGSLSMPTTRPDSVVQAFVVYNIIAVDPKFLVTRLLLRTTPRPRDPQAADQSSVLTYTSSTPQLDMPPLRSKKAATKPNAIPTSASRAPHPANMPVETIAVAGTPEAGSRKRKAAAITVDQKQALMDNLQLEGKASLNPRSFVSSNPYHPSSHRASEKTPSPIRAPRPALAIPLGNARPADSPKREIRHP
jgi:hypothetical protein